MAIRRVVAPGESARDSRNELDDALAGERAQMLIDSLAISQPEALRDLATGGREAVLCHETLNKFQYFQLLGSEIGRHESVPDGCLVSSLARLTPTASSASSK